MNAKIKNKKDKFQTAKIEISLNQVKLESWNDFYLL